LAKRHNNFILKEYFVLFCAVIISIVLMFSRESVFIEHLRVSSLNVFGFLKLDFLDYKTNSELKEENSFLKQRVISLVAENSKFKEAIFENERLKKLLEIEKDEEYTYRYAKVVGANPDNLRHTILINIGTDSGIKENDPVISINGLTGKVLKSGKNSSIVQLITYNKNRIPAITANERIPGIIRPIDSESADLREITKTRKIEVGEEIYTSKFSSIYPEGLKIGKVTFVSDSSVTIHKIIKIDFTQDFSKLEDVFVMTKAEESIDED